LPTRIGTRGSALALAQARLVAELLGGAELVTIATAGDKDSAAGDKSRWVLELERALRASEIDLAVHSAKDVPGELADGLELLGAPPRAAPEDVLCIAGSPPVAPELLGAPATGLQQLPPGARCSGLERLPSGARVGTSSLRRAAQLRAAREDLEVVAVRGNVDTRLRKLGENGFDAVVLARAGLQRLGRETEIAAVLDPARFVPSPGQGTLALEGRADDEPTRTAVQTIADDKAFACLRAERAVAHALGASCNTPLGAHAVDYGRGCLRLRAWVGLPDGSAWVSDELLAETGMLAGGERPAASVEGECPPASVGFYDPEQLGRRVAERLLSAGAGELLRHAEELAVEHA
jgi:hydroxymethylbilane synthase